MNSSNISAELVLASGDLANAIARLQQAKRLAIQSRIPDEAIGRSKEFLVAAQTGLNSLIKSFQEAETAASNSAGPGASEVVLAPYKSNPSV